MKSVTAASVIVANEKIDWKLELTTKALWTLYGSSLYLFILKRVRHPALAQDVLQDTFLKVHRHLDKLKDPSKAKAWMFQIARNQLANHFQALSPSVALSESEPSEDLFSKDDFCCFERFLEQLPGSYQVVIKLVYLEGKKNSEAANELGLSLANVKARIRRAKNILKQNFQECCLYTVNKSGKLVGEPYCEVCNAV